MRSSIRKIYDNSKIIISTGHSFIFYKNPKRKGIEILYFGGSDKVCIENAKKLNMRYLLQSEFKEIDNSCENDNKILCPACNYSPEEPNKTIDLERCLSCSRFSHLILENFAEFL